MSDWTLLVFSLPGMAASMSEPGQHGYKNSKPWLPREPVIMVPTAEELVGDRTLPKDFDWRDVNGQNFATVDINQHQPFYCGSCWVHGTTSALNDRIKIMRNARFPDVVLARQALLNCIPPSDGNGENPGCDGGDPWMIHKFMKEHKVPDETCITYAAVNQKCTPLNVCRNCFRGNDPAHPFAPGPCWAEPTYIGYGVKSYGNVSGESAMMKEIYARGPIACSGVTTRAFVHDYAQNVGVVKDGIYRDSTKFNESDVDHIMAVGGWGETAEGAKYWIVRNSWGTYWGEVGWFKVKRGENSLMLESDCHWGVPDFDDLDSDIDNRIQGDYYSGVPGGVPNILGLSSIDRANSEATMHTAIGALFGAVVAWITPRFFARNSLALKNRTPVSQPLIIG